VGHRFQLGRQELWSKWKARCRAAAYTSNSIVAGGDDRNGLEEDHWSTYPARAMRPRPACRAGVGRFANSALTCRDAATPPRVIAVSSQREQRMSANRRPVVAQSASEPRQDRRLRTEIEERSGGEPRASDARVTPAARGEQVSSRRGEECSASVRSIETAVGEWRRMVALAA